MHQPKRRTVSIFIADFVKDIRQRQPRWFHGTYADDVCRFAIIRYGEAKMELYFQNAMYVIFQLMGFYVEKWSVPTSRKPR